MEGLVVVANNKDDINKLLDNTAEAVAQFIKDNIEEDRQDEYILSLERLLYHPSDQTRVSLKGLICDIHGDELK